MAKQISYDVEAREHIRLGVKKLARAVKVTLGPRGRNVIIEKSFGSPTVTKDGDGRLPEEARRAAAPPPLHRGGPAHGPRKPLAARRPELAHSAPHGSEIPPTQQNPHKLGPERRPDTNHGYQDEVEAQHPPPR